MTFTAEPKTLLANATAPITGDSVKAVAPQPLRTYQATVAGVGTVAAEVEIHVSNDNDSWLIMARISLSGSDGFDTDGFVSDGPWGYVRAKLNSISGTNAAVTVKMGD